MRRTEGDRAMWKGVIKMTRKMHHEFIGFPEGLMNYSMIRNNPPSEVKTYYLTEEERLAAIEKYGPILMPRKKHRKMFGKYAQ